MGAPADDTDKVVEVDLLVRIALEERLHHLCAHVVDGASLDGTASGLRGLRRV